MNSKICEFSAKIKSWKERRCNNRFSTKSKFRKIALMNRKNLEPKKPSNRLNCGSYVRPKNLSESRLQTAL
jgi:hypothetical protein